jgi:hypothetical protein
MKMKMHNIYAVMAATAFITTASTQSSLAQPDTNLFRATVQLTCVTTNSSGNLVYERVGNSTFIKQCASEMGVTNFVGLSLVYNRSNSSLEVVSGTNHALLCTPLTFSGGLALSNTNNTVVELQSYVFVETNTVASGVLTATERIFPGSTNHPPAFTLIGQLNYTEPASGTNPPAICHGTLFVGSLFSFFPHLEDDATDRDSGDLGQGTSTQFGGSRRD